MNVTFTGIQNAGSWHLVFNNETKPTFRRLACQLTDKGETDLSEFKDVLKKFPDPLNHGFLRFDLLNLKSNHSKDRQFFINNEQLHLTDENLSIFGKVVKLFSKIANREEKLFLSNDYIESEDSFHNMVDGIFNYGPVATADRDTILLNFPLKSAHSFENVKSQSKSMFEDMNETIIDYLT